MSRFSAIFSRQKFVVSDRPETNLNTYQIRKFGLLVTECCFQILNILESSVQLIFVSGQVPLDSVNLQLRRILIDASLVSKSPSRILQLIEGVLQIPDILVLVSQVLSGSFELLRQTKIALAASDQR
mgnify:FL=1